MQSLTLIDGSMLEGGGQILRTAMALGALLKKPVRVNNIRAGRSKPGLMAQHLVGLHLVNSMCNGRLEGAEMGSTEVTFYPGKIMAGTYRADTHTAGSICLLLQIALPCALFSSGKVILKLRGGTNAEMAPQIDYMIDVFRPVLEKFGASFQYELLKRGYFPKGGGEVHFKIEPVKCLNAVSMVEFGKVLEVKGKAFSAGEVPLEVAKTMQATATRCIVDALRPNHPLKIVFIDPYKEDKNKAVGSGSGINFAAYTTTSCVLGSSGLGRPKLPAQEVGQKAAEHLLETIAAEACVDPYTQDQVILLMALASGTSRVRCGTITLHTQTAVQVVELMTSTCTSCTLSHHPAYAGEVMGRAWKMVTRQRCIIPLHLD